MATGSDPILTHLGMAHLANPKMFLGKGGGFLGEFREFALKGNMLDMAIGIIIGAAFGRVISSFVSDIMMPPIGRPSFRPEQQVHQSLRSYVCHAGGGEGCWSRDHQLWPLPERLFRFPHRRVRCLSSRPAGKPPAGPIRSQCAGDQGVPILRVLSAGESNTLPELHLGAKCGLVDR